MQYQISPFSHNFARKLRALLYSALLYLKQLRRTGGIYCIQQAALIATGEFHILLS